jgi:restriction system protein
MLPILEIAADGETRMPEVADRIGRQLGLTEAELEEMLPSGRQRLFYNRLAWAKFYMSKAGLIASPKRGRFTATEAGRDLVARKPKGVTLELLRSYPSFRAFENSDVDKSSPHQAAAVRASENSLATPEEQIDAAQAVLHSALKADLLQRVLGNSPAFFEHIVVNLLVSMGYGGSHEDAARQLGKSGDGGIDGVIDEDRLGLDRIYVQAKLYPTQSIGRPEIQGFVGSLVGVGATKGVFVTTSSFTSHAIEYARHLPQRVILIDGNRLAELMVECDVGVRVSRTIKVKRLDEDFFDV